MDKAEPKNKKIPLMFDFELVVTIQPNIFDHFIKIDNKLIPLTVDNISLAHYQNTVCVGKKDIINNFIIAIFLFQGSC